MSIQESMEEAILVGCTMELQDTCVSMMIMYMYTPFLGYTVSPIDDVFLLLLSVPEYTKTHHRRYI